MPKIQKTQHSFKCLECGNIVRADKWDEHCRKKHIYKQNNGLPIKKIIAKMKKGLGKWEPYRENDLPTLATQPHAAGPETSGDSVVSKLTSRNLDPQPARQTASPTSSATVSDTDRMIAAPAAANVMASTTSTSEDPKSPTMPPRNNAVRDTPVDPATYAGLKLSTQQIQLLLTLEGSEPSENYKFPARQGKKFSRSWFQIDLPDQSKCKRKWLVYSGIKDSAYCIHCLLFGLPGDRSNWSHEGYTGWVSGNGRRDIEMHEVSKQHASSQIARLQWLGQQRVDRALVEQSNAIVSHQRAVLSVIVDCCRYLSTEMVALRRKDFRKGKLAALFKMIGKYSPDAKIYWEKIERFKLENKKLASNFLSYRNIIELISTIRSIVTDTIIKRLSMEKKLSIIVDSTQDVSKKEATACLVRYPEAANDGMIRPVERLLDIFTCGDTTGESLKNKIVELFTKNAIDTAWIIGQSYDGAGNMSGKYKGLKTLMMTHSTKALYVWCSSHRFALVVEKSIECCSEFKNVFGLLEELYVFLGGHKRHHAFLEALGPSNKKRRLKRVQTTRWSSKESAVQTLISCYAEVMEVLERISLDKTSRKDAVATAKGLLKQLSDFNVMAVLKIAESVFTVLAPVTRCLQGVVVDFGTAAAIIRNCTDKMASLRSDKNWDMICNNVKNFCENSGYNPEPAVKRIPRKRKFFDELGIDDPVRDPIRRLKVDVFYKVIDALHAQLIDRFSDQNLGILKQMRHFTPYNLLNNDSSVQPSDILDLCNMYDLDECEVAKELQSFKTVYQISHDNIDLSDVIHVTKSVDSGKNNELGDSENDSDNTSANEDQNHDTDLDSRSINKQQWVKHGFLKPLRLVLELSGYRNLSVLYKILISIAVTSCSAERTMSRLKIIKNRLRSSMGDQWMSDLIILASEADILDSISNDAIINKFAASSSLRMKLLISQ